MLCSLCAEGSLTGVLATTLPSGRERRALTDLAARELLGANSLATLQEGADRIAPALSDLAGADHASIHGDLR